jgi:alkanesulfonate monooxygenase SsuD/methylene tetrahydromethanopterin reductase-like flavin-dependent oxidoreductase (luciferase family)
MGKASFGFGVPTTFTSGRIDAQDIRRMVRVAEQGGLRVIAVGDHLNWYSGTLEATTVLGFLAAETDLDLLANVIVLPLRNPYLMAKTAATIASLAAGEFSLGVGVGGANESEYAALGVDPSDRGARMDASLAILSDLLRGDGVDVDGPFHRCRAAPLDPPARVPILIGGRGPAALRRAATLADGWSAAWLRPEQFDRRAREIERELRRLGRPVEQFRFVAHARLAFGRDADDAWREPGEHMRRHYESGVVEAFRRHTICGPPGEVAAELARYAGAGAQQIVVTFASQDHTRDLRRFCDEVMPLMP